MATDPQQLENCDEPTWSWLKGPWVARIHWIDPWRAGAQGHPEYHPDILKCVRYVKDLECKVVLSYLWILKFTANFSGWYTIKGEKCNSVNSTLLHPPSTYPILFWLFGKQVSKDWCTNWELYVTFITFRT